MSDDDMALYREYARIPSSRVIDADLERMADAVFAERDRRASLKRQKPDIADCACLGPMPHCKCERRLVKQDLAAAMIAFSGPIAD